MDKKIQSRLDDFNEILISFGFPYKMDLVDPKALEPAPKNAHFMQSGMFNQLVQNIERDKNLTSIPYCWREGEKTFIISGHHRIKAGIQAGVETILIMYSDEEMTREEFIARQLSHNSIFGEDEPTLLRDLWDEIKTMDLKIYSGLDDRALDSYTPIQIDSLGEKDLLMQEVVFTFFKPEIEQLETFVKEVTKRRRKRYAADLKHFDRFVDSLIEYKEVTNIYNSSTALLTILEVVDEWLEANSQDDDQGESN
jgi:hypothetical protein